MVMVRGCEWGKYVWKLGTGDIVMVKVWHWQYVWKCGTV